MGEDVCEAVPGAVGMMGLTWNQLCAGTMDGAPAGTEERKGTYGVRRGARKWRKPRLSLYEPLYVRRYWRPELPSFTTPHQGKGGFWWSPQRYQDVGSTWRDTRRRRVVFPGNTGFSDVPSSLTAGYCRVRPTLVWRYRWQKLRERVPQVLKGRDNFLLL